MHGYNAGLNCDGSGIRIANFGQFRARSGQRSGWRYGSVRLKRRLFCLDYLTLTSGKKTYLSLMECAMQ